GRGIPGAAVAGAAAASARDEGQRQEEKGTARETHRPSLTMARARSVSRGEAPARSGGGASGGGAAAGEHRLQAAPDLVLLRVDGLHADAHAGGDLLRLEALAVIQ